MDLSTHKLESLTDPAWLDKTIEKMGEAKFWAYKNNLFKELDKLEVGVKLVVEKWSKPENFNLFIKLACYYISESNCCYQFNSNYTIITHKYDSNDTLDAKPKKICLESYQRKTQTANS